MVRRLVTANEGGRSVFVSEGPVSTTHDYAAIPGMQTTVAWQTPAVPSLAEAARDPVATLSSVLPAPHGTSLIVVRFPPDSVLQSDAFDPAAAAAEQAEHLPGLAETFEPDGMHRTQTVDYDIVLQGELWLELDDGETRRLKPGDIVVQNGTRHAWRNRSDQPAVMAAVLIGADT